LQSGDGTSGEVHRIVVADGQGQGTSGEAGDARAIFFQPDGGRQAVSLVVDADGTDDVNPNDGWLGVQVGQAQDGDSEAGGVTILNVAKGSAAEDAGFEQNDVVVEFNDVPIDGDLASLVEQIRQAGAGTHVKFTVLRNGERRTLATTLGSRADMKTFEWVFESAPDAVLHDNIRMTGRWLLRGDDNEWHVGDLTDLSDLRNNLPVEILEALPGNESRTVKVFVNDGGTSVTTTVVKDGVSIMVERADGGEIVVTRKIEGEDGETVTRYANEEELAAADQEAYDIYSESTNHMVIRMEPGGPVPNIDLNLDGGDVGAGDILENIRIELKNASEGSSGLKDRVFTFGGKGADFSTFKFREARARRSIHENADGTIEVIVRKGENELVTHYDSALDLEDRDPASYKAYQELTSNDE